MKHRSFSDMHDHTLVVLAICWLSCPPRASADWFKVTDLGPVAPGMSGAFAVNSAGQAAGFSSIADPSSLHAALWGGAVHDLGALGSDSQSNAFALDSGGAVFGVSYSFGDIGVHAFKSESGTMTGLGDFFARGSHASDALAGYLTLNIAGTGTLDHASLWQNGTLTDLGGLGGSNSYARAINSSGDVVGVSYLSDEVTTHAFLWRGGVFHDLGTLGGANSEAVAINDSGQIAGFAETTTGDPHACLFTVDAAGNVTARTDLGQLGSSFSYANGINNMGRAVGVSDGRAFLWNGALQDLNARISANSGWSLTTATAINDAGRIVGSGIHNGQFHGFLLVPASRPDFDGDGDVDMDDFGRLQECLFMPVPLSPTCHDADLDDSGTVNAADLTIFRNCAGRASVPTDPACGS